jgi:hypothetical protein
MRSRYIEPAPPNRLRTRLIPAFLLIAALGTAACDVKVGNGDFSVGVVSGKAQDEWTAPTPSSQA